MNKYDKRHIQNLAKYERQIQALFEAAIQDAANIAPLIGALGDVPFTWEDYPLALAQIRRIIDQLNSEVTTSIVNGVRSEWTLSNNKNNELCNVVFGSLATSLPEAAARRYYSTNEYARDAFLARKERGLGLSDNVWRYTNQFKGEVEMALDLGIRSGRSADEISRDLRDYLKYPDKLFRRVRDKHGQLHLSKRAAEFHPGRGVYRSSYMNARRLAATETNIAYRTADHLRWQQLDFVVGIEIHLSNNHNCKGVPAGMFFDICDELKGKYPKDFKFVGWHPHCRCYATTILKSDEEMAADNARIMAGEDVQEGSENEVSELPDNFRQWQEDNAERIARAKSTPYFLRDNEGLINRPAAVAAPTPKGTILRAAERQHVGNDTHHPIANITDADRARRKEIRWLANETIVGNNYENQNFGKIAAINKSGVKEWLNQPHMEYANKNEVLLNLPSIFRNARYLGYGTDKHRSDVILHLFETSIGSTPSWIIVREFPNGQVWIHSITDAESIKNYITNPR